MIQKFLSSVDVFGAEVGIRYEGKNKYTSKIGGFASLIVGGLLLALIYQQCMQIYSREDPNVIFQQVHVDNPSKYNLSPDKFTIMFGLHDITNIAFIDEQIYTIEASFAIRSKVIDQNNNSNYVTISSPLIVKPCSIEDFQMVEVQDYFQGLPYQSYYCIKNMTDTFLQGQFEKDLYTNIKIKVKECTNSKVCKSSQVRKSTLENSKFQIYYTHRIIDMSNYKKPFKAVGQTSFYALIYDYFTITNLIFTNTFIIDDDGLFLKNQKSQKELLFATDRFQLQTKKDSYLYQCVLYLQKDKEEVYQRSYQRVPQVFSQLGGTFQVLFIIGCMLIKPYNQIQLQRRLYDDIFSYDDNNNNQFKNNNKSTVASVSVVKQHKLYNQQSSQIYPNNTQQIKSKILISPSPNSQQNNNDKQKFRKAYSDLKIFFKKYFFQSFKNFKQKQEILENLRSLKSIINIQLQLKSLQQYLNTSQFNINNEETPQGKSNISSKFQRPFASETHRNTLNELILFDKTPTALKKKVKISKSFSSINLNMCEDKKEIHQPQQIQNEIKGKYRKSIFDEMAQSPKILEHCKYNYNTDSSIIHLQSQLNSPINKQNSFLLKFESINNKQRQKSMNFMDIGNSETPIQYGSDNYIQKFQLMNSLSSQNMKVQK